MGEKKSTTKPAKNNDDGDWGQDWDEDWAEDWGTELACNSPQPNDDDWNSEDWNNVISKSTKISATSNLTSASKMTKKLQSDIKPKSFSSSQLMSLKEPETVNLIDFGDISLEDTDRDAKLNNGTANMAWDGWDNENWATTKDY